MTGQTDEWMDRHVDDWTERKMESQKNRQADKLTDVVTGLYYKCVAILIYYRNDSGMYYINIAIHNPS